MYNNNNYKDIWYSFDFYENIYQCIKINIVIDLANLYYYKKRIQNVETQIKHKIKL